MKRKRGMSISQHKDWGMLLYEIRMRIGKIILSLQYEYSQQALRPFLKIEKRIDVLRSTFDDFLFSEYPLLSETGKTVYYPGTHTLTMDGHLSLDFICRLLHTMACDLRMASNIIFDHYPVSYGYRVLRIANVMECQSKKLPYTISRKNPLSKHHKKHIA